MSSSLTDFPKSNLALVNKDNNKIKMRQVFSNQFP